MTSISKAEQKFGLAMIIQLLVLAHAVLIGLYASMGKDLYVVILMMILVPLLYAAISVAFVAGTHWPNGGRQ